MKNPIFIVGVDRSGTTLLTMMLGMHSELWIPNESHFIVDLYNKYYYKNNIKKYSIQDNICNEIISSKYVKEWNVDFSDLNLDFSKCRNLGCIIDVFYTACANSCGKKLWGDKTPLYLTHVDIINKLFPDCRFVHIVRDGRDVAKSITKMWWGANDYASALSSWGHRVELGTKMLNMLPEERWIQVRFEDLVRNTRQELNRVMKFLNINFEENMLKYQDFSSEKVGDRINKHHANLLKPPQVDNIFRWKRNLSPADQALSWEIAGKMLQYFGYDSGVTNHRFRFFRKIYYRAIESWNYRKYKTWKVC